MGAGPYQAIIWNKKCRRCLNAVDASMKRFYSNFETVVSSNYSLLTRAIITIFIISSHLSSRSSIVFLGHWKRFILYLLFISLFSITSLLLVLVFVWYLTLLLVLYFNAQWISQTILARVVDQINEVNRSLAGVGSDDVQIGGTVVFWETLRYIGLLDMVL